MDNPVQLISQGHVHKSSLVRWLVGVIILLLITTPVAVYAWRYLLNPCEVEAVQEASVILDTQSKTYDGVYQVAVSASRTSADYPVNVMKQIFMDTQEVSVPACMQTVKKELLNYMGTVILAFQAYRDGAADAAVVKLVRQSDAQYAKFRTELKAINKCAPFCFR